MTRYQAFTTFFIISIVALVMFLIVYFQSIFSIAFHANEWDNGAESGARVLRTIFSPAVIISLVALIISSLVYKILGIVYVAGNKVATSGEKALWIVGFVIMGFVTAIVFLAIAKNRQLV